MLLKALTFSHKYLVDNFEPYILETIRETLRIAGKIIQSFDLSDESVPLNIVTVINLLQAMTFGIHPQSRTEPVNKKLLTLDHSVHLLILETIFVLLNHPKHQN